MKTSTIIFSLFLSIITIHCTIVDKQPIHDIKLLQSNDKLNIPICLIINSDLMKAKITTSPSMVTTMVIPLGENLAYHIETLTRNVFADVIVKYNDDINQINGKLKYSIIPKVLLAEYVQPAAIWATAKTTIIIEWKIINRSGNNVWIETITGTHMGRWTDERNRYFLKEIFYDILQHSQKQMLSSKILRNLN